MVRVSKEIAIQEVEKWLDYKRVSENKRESFSDYIDEIVNAICDGILILNEDFTFTHKLLFPFGKEIKVTEFNYKPRLSQGVLSNYLTGVKPGDADGRATAHIAAIAGEPKEVIKGMDTEDYRIAGQIAVFFM